MIEFPESFRWLIAGPTGSGKSYFAGWIAEKLHDLEKRFIVLDTDTKNHYGLVQLKKVKLLRIKPGYDYDFWKVANIRDSVLVVPTEAFLLKKGVDELIEIYKHFLKVIFRAKKPVVVFIEEVHRYQHGYKPDKSVEVLAREGRKYGINPIYITQRIQEFPKILWSNCTGTFVFRWTIPQDIRYIKDMIPNFEEINRELRRHDVLFYNHITGEIKMIPKEMIIRRTKHYG